MEALLKTMTDHMVSIAVYGAIVAVFLVGLVKCVFPSNRLAGLFRRGVRLLERMTITEGTRPVWQDPLFLGKPMQPAWKRFLTNADQLDQRGLPCDSESFINDDTVLVTYTHQNLAELIPGFLTSLGILGTFIGLMRGLGNLDISSAETTMQGITRMIAGMSFAYGTSIAGLVTSMAFNILWRGAQSGAMRAMDDFHEVFRELVMQRPLDYQVHRLLYQEDQAVFLNRAMGDLSGKLKEGLEVAVDRAFVPIGQSIQRFVMGETQAQLDGINHLAGQFVQQMNQALGGQISQLGRSLHEASQAQGLSVEQMNSAIAAAEEIMQSIDRTNQVSEAVIQRFDSYVKDLSQAQSANVALTGQTAALMDSLHGNLDKQIKGYEALSQGQNQLTQNMRQYADWSGRVLDAVEKQAKASGESASETAKAMQEASGKLASSYGHFVENISSGLARTVSLFEDNMRDVLSGVSGEVKRLSEAVEKQGGALDVKALGDIERTLDDMAKTLKKATAQDGAAVAP